MRAKYNFRDSININNGWKIGTVVITPTGAQFNYLSIATGTTGTGNLVFSASPAFTGSVPTTGGIPLGRVSSITASLSAGVETDITLTGVTTEPFSIQIFDSDGYDLTQSVKDSIGTSGGTYHVYIYSTDAKTNAKIKVLW
jgi:hypothetical protein